MFNRYEKRENSGIQEFEKKLEAWPKLQMT